MSPGISTRLLATQSDERLLALVRDGHERAFEALVNRYRRPLLSYCRRLSLPEARAEDVLQQALLKTWIALRDGAEVRDIKAWLYRVVHNTAVNAVRDAVHDRERLTDPTLRAGVGQADLERGLVVREALAEVAALPRLQREAIVRTAVGGHSHEQVASDLGITDGAVRGLLYRARATLRTATTAVTPVSWLSWFAGRAEQSAPASERLGELAAGGGAAGLGGLLLKGAVVAVTAGTLLTGAAVVHLQAHHVHHAPGAAPPQTASAAAGGSTIATPAPTVRGPVHVASGRGALRVDIGHNRSPAGAAPGARQIVASAPVKSLRATNPKATAPAPSTPVGSTQVDGTQQSATSTPSGGSGQAQTGSGQSSGAGTSQGGPVGSAAGSGSTSEAGTSSGGGETPPPSEGESAGTSQPSESSGTQSASGESESANGTQSGGVVGTVVHEVGSLLEHLLH